MDIAETVGELIANDRRKAEAIGNDLVPPGNPNASVSDEDIRLFFPEFYGVSPAAQVTNLPRGLTLRHYVLLGSPVVLDINPATSHQFASTQKVSISFVAELADHNLVVPNLYIRDHRRWVGKEEMLPLVKRATAMGERVDAYMARRGDYSKHVHDHEVELRRLFATGSWAVLSKAVNDSSAHGPKGIEDPEALAIREARRWAYLDVLAPDESVVAARLLAEEDALELIRFLYISKHKFASHITACMGGRFVFGPSEFVESGTIATSKLADVTQKLNAPEALEYLVREIAGVESFPISDGLEERAIIDFLIRADNALLRNQLTDRLDDLMTEALENQIDTSSVLEFKKMIEDYRSRLRAARLLAGSGIAGGLAAFGTLLGPVGAVMGGMIGFLIGRQQAIPDYLILKGGQRRLHRTFLYIEKLKERRGEAVR